MTSASRSRLASAAFVAAVAALLAACTSTPGSGATASTPSPARPTALSPAPSSRTTVPRPPIPTASAPSALPAISDSPGDLGRVDIRNGAPRSKRADVRLPAASGYSVAVGCLGRPGALLHWSVIGTSDAYAGFLFGSTTPCNGAFLTDTAMANIEERTPARLEVTLDPGVEAATVVLRTAPADAHL